MNKILHSATDVFGAPNAAFCDAIGPCAGKIEKVTCAECLELEIKFLENDEKERLNRSSNWSLEKIESRLKQLQFNTDIKDLLNQP